METCQMLPAEITEIVQAASGKFGSLAFGGGTATWQPVSDFRSLPDETAIYAIGLRLGVQYPRMTSKIIYFGSTAKLRARIRSYANGGHNARLDLLHRRFPGGLECSFYLVPGLDLQWRRAIEDAALQAAFRSFGCYPLCNMAPIDSTLCAVCHGVVTIAECVGLPFPQGISNLNCGNGVLENYPLVRLEKLMCTGEPESNTSDVSINPEEMERVNQARERQHELEHLAWITQENVVMWSEEKMRRIIQLCRLLTRVVLRGKSKVITFESPTSTVPQPETWGEVALFKARELAGSFYSQSRIWLKVRHQKVLLGQAILEPQYYRGEDKSDLPQTKRRDTIWRNSTWLREVKAIEGVVPDAFQPKQIEIPSLPQINLTEPNAEIYSDLLSAARKFDVEEARRQLEWEIHDARQRDQYSKAGTLLEDRIELRYREACETD